MGKAALGLGPDRIRTLWFLWQQIALIWFKWGESCDLSCAFNFDWIFFILAGNEDNHKILDEIEIRPDPTTDCGVSSDCASEKNPIDL